MDAFQLVVIVVIAVIVVIVVIVVIAVIVILVFIRLLMLRIHISATERVLMVALEQYLHFLTVLI